MKYQYGQAPKITKLKSNFIRHD